VLLVWLAALTVTAAATPWPEAALAARRNILAEPTARQSL
jgi:hypothetical protein